MTNIPDELQNIFGDRFRENEPLAKHVNMRIGGPAKWFCEVKTVEELQEAIDVLDGSVPYVVLGGGSNSLVSDNGFDGVVFKLAMRGVKIDGNTVIADAGAISAAVARQTANAGLAGFTWAISLPGTIGGAVRGNAGCFGGEMKDSVTKVDVLRDGKVITVTAEDMQFGYRESAVKHNDDIVLRAYLALEPGDPDVLKAELMKNIDSRKSSQPLHAGSAGCMFKNVEVTDEQLAELQKHLSIPDSMVKGKRISTGWLIDQLDMKGLRVGDAQISEEHGNFLINHGGATASDIVQLISRVKTEARDRLGVQLQEEVQYIGF